MKASLKKHQWLAVIGMTINGILLLLLAIGLIIELVPFRALSRWLLNAIVPFIILSGPPAFGWISSKRLYRAQGAARIREMVGSTVFFLGHLILYGGIFILFPNDAGEIAGPMTIPLIFSGCTLSVLLYIIIVRPLLLTHGYKYPTLRQAFPVWTIPLLAILLYLSLGDNLMKPVATFEEKYSPYGWLVRAAFCGGLYYLGRFYFSEGRTASKGETEAPQIGLHY